MVRPLRTCVIITIAFSLILGCSKPSDQKAYEEVLATMSMDKAKIFFEKYPKSKYRDKLADFMINWANKEGNEESHKLILYALPRDHPKYNLLLEYCKKNWGSRCDELP